MIYIRIFSPTYQQETLLGLVVTVIINLCYVRVWSSAYYISLLYSGPNLLSHDQYIILQGIPFWIQWLRSSLVHIMPGLNLSSLHFWNVLRFEPAVVYYNILTTRIICNILRTMTSVIRITLDKVHSSYKRRDYYKASRHAGPILWLYRGKFRCVTTTDSCRLRLRWPIMYINYLMIVTLNRTHFIRIW